MHFLLFWCWAAAFLFRLVAAFCASVAGPDRLNFKIGCLFHQDKVSDDRISRPMQLIIHCVMCVTSSKNFNNSCFENFMPTSPQLDPALVAIL